jgi:hypothetical protein
MDNGLTSTDVKRLTFTIDPAARWGSRESGPMVPLNLLPLFWTTRVNSQPERLNASTRSRSGNLAACPRHIHPPVMRNLLQARLACATHAIRRTNHSSYEGYSISTIQNENGKWVAVFGRRGDLIASGRAKKAVLETAPKVAEVIAIADAQIAIDDRLADKAR